uniref:Putative sigma-70 region domain containing protein n=1 Tax=viral metagenome TaxID=1070528 RepID=A0A6M3XM79_9ZZZZ
MRKPNHGRRPGKSWPKYEKLVAKLAWQRSRTTGMDFDELMAEGRLAFTESLRSYDNSKAKFSTHLTWQVRGRLSRITRTQNKLRTEVELNEDTMIQEITPERHARFTEAMDNLSSEAQMVVQLVLNSPLEIIQSIKKTNRGITVGLIKSFLANKGWDQTTTKSAVDEIKTTLQNL